MEQQLTVPTDYESIGVIMSNFDHTIRDEQAEERLKHEKIYGEYTAYNFWAAIWFADNVFKCMVKQYQQHVSTLSAKSLQEVMEIASERYGFE